MNALRDFPRRIPPLHDNMARSKSTRKRSKGQSKPLFDQISDDRKREILGLLIMLIAILVGLAILSYAHKDDATISDPPPTGQPTDQLIQNVLGRMGAFLAYLFVPNGLGYFALFVPVLLTISGFYIFRNQPLGSLRNFALKAAWSSLLLATFCGWVGLTFMQKDGVTVPVPSEGILAFSGLIGWGVAEMMGDVFGTVGTLLILLIIFVVSLMLMIEGDVQTSVDNAVDAMGSTKDRISGWLDNRRVSAERTRQERKEVPIPAPAAPNDTPPFVTEPSGTNPPTTAFTGLGRENVPPFNPVEPLKTTLPPPPRPAPPVHRPIPDEYADLAQDVDAYRMNIGAPQVQPEAAEEHDDLVFPPRFESASEKPMPPRTQLTLPLQQAPSPAKVVTKVRQPQRVITTQAYEAEFSMPSIELMTDGENESRKLVEAETQQIEQSVRELLKRRNVQVEGIEAQKEATFALLKVRLATSPDLMVLADLEQELSRAFFHARITVPASSQATLAVEIGQRGRAQAEETYDDLVEAITNASMHISALNQTQTQAGLLYELVPAQDVDMAQVRAFVSGLSVLQKTRTALIPTPGQPSLLIRVPTRIGLDLEQKKYQLIEKLKTYNIELKEVEAIVGPTVTMFELTPAPGVKISKIKSLEDDLAMALAARGIRIIAPIPGKAAIGIEIPNKRRELVRVRSILQADGFRNSSLELPVAMGKTIEGEVYLEDLTKMPHLLIAGATGSGKSVGVNCLIAGLLYHCHPKDLKFVMIDPKKIELQQYAAIADHYIAMPETAESPIITDFTQAFSILKSCEKEMELRYDLLADLTVRGIRDYNRKVEKNNLEGTALRDHPQVVHRHLPYIVVIVDELADLMMTAGKDIEGPIARLAQMARAVGIHLVLATQRPSVDVITGLIKANFPARMAYQVASKIDSRTILDQNGAEQLVGNGDLLYMVGSRMIRLQGPFVSVDEVEDLVQFIAKQKGVGPYPLPTVEEEQADTSGKGEEDANSGKRDPLFEECARILVRSQQGSVSLLQRKLSIGYTRAARIVDQLEKAGIVGPFEGSKARSVLVKDEFQLDDFLRNIDS